MISIAPNPTSDLVNIDFFTPDTDTYTITVTNMVGQTISESQPYLEEGNQRQNIDFSNFDNGIYFLSISNGTESSVYKIIKQ
ncbi:T9SS type A sorting domain-containing protein [Lewinella cohaerens]|uniref:T9SS type A sorting domain-containing protein n=1 Tax=Lewinella cohaerens TaxID=70995 RepID=UPI003CCBF0C7